MTSTVEFVPIQLESEYEYCARLMVSTEPWVTLGRTKAGAFSRLKSEMVDVYLAKIDGQNVGFAIIRLKEAFSGYIQTIAIDSGYQNMGVGSKFIAFLEQIIFKTLPNAFLCVSSFNLNAKRFYESMGYQEVGELTNYVIDGKSEILMRKSRGSLASYGLNN